MTRPEEEIVAAHDRLVALLMNEITNPFPDLPQPMLVAVTDVLCWVLQHDHNTKFQENLDKLDRSMLESGCVLERRKP
jgi:hypothetical protein